VTILPGQRTTVTGIGDRRTTVTPHHDVVDSLERAGEGKDGV